jgi:hypothetical protein
MATELWPVDDSGLAIDRDRTRLQRSIERSGADTLLVVVGPKSEVMSDSDLDWARGVIRGLVRKQQERIPIIKDVIVTRFHPLTLHSKSENSEIPLPSFSIDDMNGVLEDLNGHRAELTTGRILLNGAVVNIEETIIDG